MTLGADSVNDGDVSATNPIPTDVREILGVTVLAGTGVVGAGVPRVTLVTDVDVPTTGGHTRTEAFKEANAIGAEMDDTTTVVATEGNVSPLRIDTDRSLYVQLRSLRIGPNEDLGWSFYSP